MDNKNLPAYPANYVSIDGRAYNSYEDGIGGLSKREIIAAMCLQGLLSNERLMTSPHLSVLATECADALLTHLQNNP